MLPSCTGRGIQIFPQRSHVHSRASILTVRITLTTKEYTYVYTLSITYVALLSTTWQRVSVFIHFALRPVRSGVVFVEGKGLRSDLECTKMALNLHSSRILFGLILPRANSGPLKQKVICCGQFCNDTSRLLRRIPRAVCCWLDDLDVFMQIGLRRNVSDRLGATAQLI